MNVLYKTIDLLFYQRLDLVCSIFGFILGVFIIVLSYVFHLGQQDIGLAVSGASIVFLLIRKKLAITGNSYKRRLTENTFLLLSNILFVALLLSSIYILRNNLYQRPLTYFIIMSTLFAGIAFEILYITEKRNFIYSVITKIIIASVCLRAGLFYEYPTLVGTDTWFHVKYSGLIAQFGNVPAKEIFDASQYQFFPVFHIDVAMNNIITGLDLKNALFFSIAFTNIVSTLFVYLIGNILGGFRFGLFALLIVNVSDMLILLGVTNMNTGTLVLSWFMTVLYILFLNRRDFGYYLIVIILLFTMILTHQLTVFTTFIALIGVFIGKHIFNYLKLYNQKFDRVTEKKDLGLRIYKSNQGVSLNIVLLLVFCIGMFFYWMNVFPSDQTTTSFFDGVANRILKALRADSHINVSNPYAGLASSYSLLSNALYHGGYLVLLFLAVVGFFIWLSKKEISERKMAFIIALLLLFVCTYGSPMTSMGMSMIPHRWLPFVYVILSLLAAQFFVSIFSLLKRRIFAQTIIIIGMLLLVFFMITTPYINTDNPVFCKNRVIRSNFTSSEISAASAIIENYQGTIITDPQYASIVFNYVLDKGDNEIRFITEPGTSKTQNGMLLFRKKIISEPIQVSPDGTFGEGRVEIIGAEVSAFYEMSHFAHLIYDNGMVLTYNLHYQE